MVKAVALHDYEATDKGEVNLTAGATVHIISKGSGTWWLVECNGYSGYVPPSYLEELPAEEQQDSFEAVAIYTHEAGSDAEITFYEGERVRVLESDNDEWWYGLIQSEGADHSGTRVAGYFASNFVDRVKADEPPVVAHRRLATIRQTKPSLPARPNMGTMPRPKKVEVVPADTSSAPPPLPSREDKNLIRTLEFERNRARRLEREAREKEEKLAQAQMALEAKEREMEEMLRQKEEAMKKRMEEMEQQLRESQQSELLKKEQALRASQEQRQEELAAKERELAEARAEAERREQEAIEERARTEQRLRQEREEKESAAAEPVVREREVVVRERAVVEQPEPQPQRAVVEEAEPASPTEPEAEAPKASSAARKKRPSKFDNKDKKKFVSGGVNRRSKTRKYGVTACEVKEPSKALNNLDGDAFY